VLEIDQKNKDAFMLLARKHGIDPLTIGKTSRKPILNIQMNGKLLLSEPIQELLTIWEEGLQTAW